MMRKSIFVIACMISFGALAAPMDGAPAADCDGIKVATGPAGKGYSNLFSDMKKVCGNKVSLCEVKTEGGLDNLNALSTKEADIGFVQIDTFNDMKNGDENIAALQKIIPLNYNYLHVVVSSVGYTVTSDKRFAGVKFGSDSQQIVINSFTDLRGKTVALVGSAKLLGRRLNQQLGYNMQFVDAKDDAQAFQMVKNGQVAAMFTVSGWPSGSVKQLSQNDGLTLVTFNAPVNEPFKVKALNYKNIAVYNNNSLAVQNILVTRPFSGQRASNIASLQSCIMSNLNELKEGNYQPGWNEVKDVEIPGIQSFKKK